MLIENPMAKMRETMEPRSEVPDGTDLRSLMITFTLDGAETLAGGPETLYAWVDMQTAPVDGDIVLRRAINVDEDGYAVVKARAWFSHNWLMLWLDRFDHETDDDNG